MRNLTIWGAVAVLAVLVAAVVVFGLLNSGQTAFAGDSPVTICHFDAGKITGQGDHTKVHVAPSWSVIEVGSANSDTKHHANHENFHNLPDSHLLGAACTSLDAAPLGFGHLEIIGAHAP